MKFEKCSVAVQLKLQRLRAAVPGIFAAATLMSGLTAASVHAGVIAPTYDVTGAPTLEQTWTIGQSSPNGIRPAVVTPGAAYSDDTTFSGSAVYAGTNGTTKFTSLLADDITTSAASSFTLGQFTFGIANGAAVAQTISPYVRFFAADGTGGTPGTYLGGINFNGISVAADNVAGFNYNASSLAITLPTSFWACEFYSTTGSLANAAKVGDGTFNPPDIGTSADEDFMSSTVSTSSSSFVSNSPAGTVNVSPYAGSPVANFEWEFNAAAPVPEPTSLSLCAIGAVGTFVRLRRRRCVTA
jgi:hypothetical protein